MGIYIKGMEMPKVPTRFIIFADGRVEDEMETNCVQCWLEWLKEEVEPC